MAVRFMAIPAGPRSRRCEFYLVTDATSLRCVHRRELPFLMILTSLPNGSVGM
jgi:hypothetical protein